MCLGQARGHLLEVESPCAAAEKQVSRARRNTRERVLYLPSQPACFPSKCRSNDQFSHAVFATFSPLCFACCVVVLARPSLKRTTLEFLVCRQSDNASHLGSPVFQGFPAPGRDCTSEPWYILPDPPNLS